MKTKAIICKNNSFYKTNSKKAISLITLVITIVVVIILAAAIVMSLNNNNVLTNASSARYTTDLDTMQSYFELAIQKATLKHQGTLEVDSGEITMDTTSNVKETKGTIAWESTDIGNLSGEIIFDEGTDTDTTFYTGYKLPVYGSETKWYVDENGKLVLQTGSRIYGADEIPSKTINARKILNNPQKYYGAYVNYIPDNTLSEEYKWRIFYATNENIFLISSDYINVDDLPTTAQGNKPLNENTNYPKAATLTKILNDYSGSASIDEDIKWFNKDYFNKGYNSTNNNMKAISYLLDKSIWTNKFIGANTNYVVGGPSLEMLLTSYNQFSGQSIMYLSIAENSTGYVLSYDGGINWNWSLAPEYLTRGDDLYKISNYVNKANAYWLSSPSASDIGNIMYINCSGNVFYSGSGADLGFRPIVCLKSNTSLKEIEEGKNYEL